MRKLCQMLELESDVIKNKNPKKEGKKLIIMDFGQRPPPLVVSKTVGSACGGIGGKIYSTTRKRGKLFPKNVYVNRGYTIVRYTVPQEKGANCSQKMCM